MKDYILHATVAHLSTQKGRICNLAETHGKTLCLYAHAQTISVTCVLQHQQPDRHSGSFHSPRMTTKRRPSLTQTTFSNGFRKSLKQQMGVWLRERTSYSRWTKSTEGVWKLNRYEPTQTDSSRSKRVRVKTKEQLHKKKTFDTPRVIYGGPAW